MRSVVVLLLGLAAAGCRSGGSDAGEAAVAAGSSSARSPAVEAPPIPSADMAHALNPDGEKPYSGPIGKIRGVVRAEGDPAPELPSVLARIPAGKCDDARAFYGKLFREGPGRGLGDVLVAVTGYKGFVPSPGPARTVRAQGCAYESRTIAMVFGQRLEVKNVGPEPFIPELLGAGQVVFAVAIPGGDPVKLFPVKVGQYTLLDRTHEFPTAEVFVLKFPTATVTGLDGNFEIDGIPAGEVLVSALLPVTKETSSRKVTVVAGETATVDFSLRYERPSAAAPSASAR